MENYSVFVKLILQNELSAGLLLASGQFTKLNAQAELFQARLKSIKSMALIGGGLLFTGLMGLDLVGKALKPAEEYAHQLNIMNMAGLKQKEIAEAIGVSWNTTHKIMTTSATDNLRALMDMRNVMGDMDMATKMLPMFSQMQAVLMSSTEGKTLASSKSFANDFAFSVAKSLDIIGKVKDSGQFEQQALEMSKVITAYQGRVTPRMFQSVFAYARQAKFDLDDEFKYRFLPTMMLEYSQSASGAGGGSRGVGPMLAAMYRFTNQGYVNKKSLPELEALGLVHQGASLKTTTSGTTTEALTNHGLAARDPFLWVQETLVPAIKKKYGQNITDEELRFHINQLVRGNQLAAAALIEFATKPFAYWRDKVIIDKALPVNQAFDKAMIADPALAHLALSKQWENLQIALTVPIVKILIPALTTIASGLNAVSEVLMKYPLLAKTLTYGFIGLSAAMAFGGTILLLTAGFRAIGGIVGFIPPLLSIAGTAIRVFVAGLYSMLVPLGVVSLPVLGIAAAIGLLAYGAYKLYQTLKGTNWTAVFSALSDAIVNFAKNIAKAIGATVGTLAGAASHFLVNPNSTIKSGSSQSTILYHTTKLDTKTIATSTTKYMVDSANRVPNNTARFDTGMSPTPVLMKQGTY